MLKRLGIDYIDLYQPARIDSAVPIEETIGAISEMVQHNLSALPSKAALRDAVAKRWLHRVGLPLAGIAEEQGAATKRLHRWFEQLMALKPQKVLDDPEMFATYSTIAQETKGMVQAQIVKSGVSNQEFKVADSYQSAKAVFAQLSDFIIPLMFWNGAIQRLMLTLLKSGSCF